MPLKLNNSNCLQLFQGLIRCWKLALLFFAFPITSVALSSGDKRTKVDKVIIHSIGGPECKDNKIVSLPASGTAEAWIEYFADHKVLGIHYIIDKAGNVAKGIPEDEIANHAKGSNDTSIGIELVNWGDGKDPYTLEQVTALIKLLKEIQQRWSVSTDRILSHAQVDKQFLECGGKRIKLKQDPGENLYLEKLLEPDFQPKLVFETNLPIRKQPDLSSLQDIQKACSSTSNASRFKVVVEDSLSIRVKPTVKSERLGWLKPNEVVKINANSCSKQVRIIAGIAGLWVEVSVEGVRRGYVFSGFLELSQ